MPHANTTLRLADIEVARSGLGTNRLTKTREHRAFLLEAVGSLLLGRGAIEEAEALLRESVRLHPRDPEARRSLARALDALGRSEEAAVERKAADEIEAERELP